MLGLSNTTREEILRDIFSKPKGLLWEESSQFLEQASRLMKKWDDLEGAERQGTPQFYLYFKKQYLHDLRDQLDKVHNRHSLADKIFSSQQNSTNKTTLTKQTNLTILTYFKTVRTHHETNSTKSTNCHALRQTKTSHLDATQRNS